MNINDKVLVRLTPIGHALLAANHAKLFEGARRVPEFVPPRTRPDGWTEFQLWVLMAEFGPHCYNGRFGQLFIDNEVRIP